MYRKIYAVVAFLALACLVDVAPQETTEEPGTTLPDATDESDTCDIPVKDVYLTWDDVRKIKERRCNKGMYPACVPCDKHTRKHRKGWQKMCADCPEGYGTITTGSNKCYKICEAGFYFNTTKERPGCVPCPKGTYMNFPCLRTECKPCPEGLTTGKTKSTSKDQCRLSCPAGQQANADMTACELCPEGTYKEEEGVDECKPCTATGSKTTLVDGATNKTTDCVKICDVGKEYNPIDDTCSACLKGFFKATAGSREKCEPCGLNMATAGRGADSCFVECGPGYEYDGIGGCNLCPFNTFKSSSGNDVMCETCPTTATGIPKVTKTMGATGKIECVRLDDCVTPALQHLTAYHTAVAESNFTGDANIVSFWKETCFDERSFIINTVVNDYKTCTDLRIHIQLPDVTIGSRTYGHSEQLALFAGAARHDGSYCHFLRCTEAHLEELDKCKGVMEDNIESPREFCSEEWRVGAKCIMLNVKNCPALQLHPSVREDINLNGVDSSIIYGAWDINNICGAGPLF